MAKTEPERSCIVTREVKPKEDLIRFVLSPEGVLVPDVSAKLPGRGMYVSVSKLLLIEALHKKAFNRAAGEPVTVPDGLLANVEAQLQRRVSDALSLARKAGQVITGFEKVDKALKYGKVVALVHAVDASDDGVRKLRVPSQTSPFRREVDASACDGGVLPPLQVNPHPAPSGADLPPEGGGKSLAAFVDEVDAAEDDGFLENPRQQNDIPTFRNLPRDVISGVLGRENAVHVAITGGSAAKFFIAEARRFALFLQ